MSKPVLDIKIGKKDGKKCVVAALIDSGSFYTVIREDCLPADVKVDKFKRAEKMGMAGKAGYLRWPWMAECRTRQGCPAFGRSIGETVLIMNVNGHPISDEVRISPDLKRDFILGAGTMQKWDITIKNKNGRTKIIIGHDMNDPDVQAVE